MSFHRMEQWSEEFKGPMRCLAAEQSESLSLVGCSSLNQAVLGERCQKLASARSGIAGLQVSTSDFKGLFHDKSTHLKSYGSLMRAGRTNGPSKRGIIAPCPTYTAPLICLGWSRTVSSAILTFNSKECVAAVATVSTNKVSGGHP